MTGKPWDEARHRPAVQLDHVVDEAQGHSARLSRRKVSTKGLVLRRVGAVGVFYGQS